MKVVTAAQMTALEQASERQGVSTDTLMENAGLRVAEAARKLMGGAAGKRVLVLVGPGNNGADGLVTARHLRRWGADVVAYVVTRRPDADPKMDLAIEYDVTINGASGDADLRALDRTVARCDLIIDAVLGTGRSRPLTGPVKDVVSRLRPTAASGPPILAMDLPTGLNPDTGEVDPAGITADVTVTLGRPKVGLLTFPGAAFAGRLEVADIGLPPGLELERSIDLEMLTDEWVKDRLPHRLCQLPQGVLRSCPSDCGLPQLRGGGLSGRTRGGSRRSGPGNAGRSTKHPPHSRRQAYRGHPPSASRRRRRTDAPRWGQDSPQCIRAIRLAPGRVRHGSVRWRHGFSGEFVVHSLRACHRRW